MGLTKYDLCQVNSCILVKSCALQERVKRTKFFDASNKPIVQTRQVNFLTSQSFKYILQDRSYDCTRKDPRLPAPADILDYSRIGILRTHLG